MVSCDELESFLDAQASAAQVTDLGAPYHLRIDYPDRPAIAASLQARLATEGAVIPRTIHQIWIGPRTPPWNWIDSFRRDFARRHPEWKYRLWRDADVEQLALTNQSLYAQEPEWFGKADILRYEILYRYGGLYIDADTRWLNGKPLDDLRWLADGVGIFAAAEDGEMLANGVIGCTRGHPAMRLLIATLASTYAATRIERRWPPWIASGPRFFSEVMRGLPICKLPGHYLYPRNWHGIPLDIDTSAFPDSYMIQYGYSTNRRSTSHAASKRG